MTPWWRRLGFRLYVISVVQFAVTLATVDVLLRLYMPPHEHGPHGHGHHAHGPPPGRGPPEQRGPSSAAGSSEVGRGPDDDDDATTTPPRSGDRAGAAPPRRGRPPPPVFWALGISLVVAAIASVLTSRSLVAPLRRLVDAALRLGRGDLGARVELRRNDELGALGAAFDEMAGRLQQQIRGQQELLANVSHELRTPLARIRVALDIAHEGDATVAREALGEIAEDLAELETLVGDVLRMARLELTDGAAPGGGTTLGGARPPLRLERVDVAGLVERARARFASAHPARTLTAELDAALGAIDGDAVLLRRVLDNLLENAAKYSDGEITLRAARADGQLRFAVVDRGIGIAPEDLARVTEPFFRADRSRTRRTGGLGLGLSLARRIVEAHRGTLGIESTLGEGTTVTVTLPAPDGRASVPPDAGSGPDRS